MFENIAQLENEVKEFEKNILASKALIEHLNSLIDAINANNSAFEKGSELLQQAVNNKTISDAEALDKLISYVQHSNTSAVEEVKNYNSGIQNSFTHNTSEIIASVQSLAEANASSLDNTLEDIRSSNDETVKAVCKSDLELQSALAEKVNTLIAAVDEKSEADKIAVENAVTALKENIQSSIKNLEDKQQVLQSYIAKNSDEELLKLDKNIEAALADIRSANKELAENIASGNASLLNSTLVHIDDSIKTYNSKLAQTSNELESCKEVLTQKYNEFESRLDEANLAAFYDKLDSMEKHIKSKFTLLYACFGISIAVAVISIFL